LGSIPARGRVRHEASSPVPPNDSSRGVKSKPSEKKRKEKKKGTSYGGEPMQARDLEGLSSSAIMGRD
jgi:hypothetical protein